MDIRLAWSILKIYTGLLIDLSPIYKTNEKYKPITDFILKYDETSVNPDMVEKNNNEG